MKRHLISPPRRGAPRQGNPLWYKDAIIYEVRVRSFYDSNGDGIGDFRGLSAQARLPAGPRRHRDLAPAVLPLAPARRRLRHRRLHRRPSGHGHAGRLRPLARRGAPARPARHHRAGAEPHLGPAPLVPARAAGAGRLGGARLLRLERHAGALPRGAHHLQGLRALELVVGSAGATPTYWHRFYAHQPDLNFENPAVHEALLERGRLLVRHGGRRAAARRRAVPLRGRRDELREPPPDARVPQEAARAHRREVQRTGCCSPRRTSGRKTPPPTSATATSAT